jgi:hypothetical protein
VAEATTPLRERVGGEAGGESQGQDDHRDEIDFTHMRFRTPIFGFVLKVLTRKRNKIVAYRQDCFLVSRVVKVLLLWR